MTKMVTNGGNLKSGQREWVVKLFMVKRLLARLAGLEPATRGLGNP